MFNMSAIKQSQANQSQIIKLNHKNNKKQQEKMEQKQFYILIEIILQNAQLYLNNIFRLIMMLISFFVISFSLIIHILFRQELKNQNYDPVKIIQSVSSSKLWDTYLLDILIYGRKRKIHTEKYQNIRKLIISSVLYYLFANIFWFIHQKILHLALLMKNNNEEGLWKYYFFLLLIKIVIFKLLLKLCQQIYYKFNSNNENLNQKENQTQKHQKYLSKIKTKKTNFFKKRSES